LAAPFNWFVLSSWLFFFFGGLIFSPLPYYLDPALASVKMAPFIPSLLNTFLGYDAIGYGVPYGNIANADMERESMAELSGQIIALLFDFYADPAIHPPVRKRLTPIPAHENEIPANSSVNSGLGVPVPPSNVPTEDYSGAISPSAESQLLSQNRAEENSDGADTSDPGPQILNAALGFLAVINSDGDYNFIVRGARALLTTPLLSSWLPGSFKRTHMHTEVVLLLWRLCETNKGFLAHLLKSSDCLDLLAPVLHYLYEDREALGRMGFIQAGVLLLLQLSGERNFSVRLNKPFDSASMNFSVPVFDGHYGDLLVLVRPVGSQLFLAC
jgi:hypothetical protein